VCVGIALPLTELPGELVKDYKLGRRIHERDGREEVRFLFRDFEPLLPVRDEGQLRLVRWCVRRRESKRLPCTGWTWKETVNNGGWAGFAEHAALVEVPAAWGLEGGIWFRIDKGVQGLLVTDERGVDVAYLVCEPADNYFLRMTQSRRMPVLLAKEI
jgi:hypothetical protein